MITLLVFPIAIGFGYVLGIYIKEIRHEQELKRLKDQVQWWKGIAEKRGALQPPDITFGDNK